MSNYIHISTVRKMLQSPEPVNISFWTKDGQLICWEKVVGLRSSHYNGTRNIKSLTSGEIRRIRDVLIYEINGLKVIL